MKKIIFMGTPFYATCILKALIENNNFELLALFTQPDKAVGRKQILTPSHTKLFLSQNYPNIPIFTPFSLKDENIIERIREFQPDFIVVAAYGKILPKAILDIAPCVNLHASLLPKYRGASPIQSAILNNDEKSGVCSMLMQEGLDAGDILESVECDIKDKNSTEVFELLAHLAAKLILSTLLNFDKITPKRQDPDLVTFCTKIKKEDGLVNLENARELYQKYLAFMPWPGVFLQSGLKFLELELVDEFKQNAKMGEILKLEKESFLLSCKQGILRVKKLQESGKKILDGRTYLNGKRLKNEDCLC
ncbi:methionyl-tRNA formyltransferase [Campylobacter sp. VicNov18]|uniref:methionyl-tRNA formyltransferase n=1 Tax=Campylobacter bilis TaxID=2691918 RepID=UPI00130D633C|nr:methionyl-tRNA formyltransferase [Campylobacter bilis]MPV63048.1 methionyl-tRNA formyltransferase [Campylobacter hepaticus]MBM0636547.1 methionyl-tRNA formyltransferase [Campylobacter bilis]MCC8277257.1 methionyl-tRNA formyltransferase [Campylobacter bilis]MCC8299000.1 methionyl-tRNA formyltransferase [Campylobacter bilis]MCC8300166.1 methionyl-tRNA formyltransferase [Campylobacter bilis]